MNAPYIDARATTATLTAAIERSPEHLRPILMAVRDCRVGMMFVSHDAGKFVIPEGRPAIVMLGDDMEVSTGPAGFHLPSIRRAIRSCAGFAVVSAEPNPAVYAGVAAVAVAGKRAMLIETRIEHEFAWVELVQKLAPNRPLMILTVKGGHA
jgi:hypothetical protein